VAQFASEFFLAAEFFTAEVAEDAEGAERTRLGSREASESWAGSIVANAAS
jgi:hypothetical protein